MVTKYSPGGNKHQHSFNGFGLVFTELWYNYLPMAVNMTITLQKALIKNNKKTNKQVNKIGLGAQNSSMS